jgi:ankyrin repeat protein
MANRPPPSERDLLALSIAGLQYPKNIKAKNMRGVSRYLRNTPEYISKHGSAGAIFKWIQDNNMEMIQKIYPSDLDSMRQNDKQIGLTLAIRHGNTFVIQLLLNHGADVNLTDDVWKIPPLSLICFLNKFTNVQDRYPGKLKLEIIQMLLHKGANANVMHNSNTALLELCSSNLISVDMLKALIEAGADVSITSAAAWSRQNCLHLLAQKPNENLIQYILHVLESKPEIKADLINQQDSMKKTPLHYAVKTGNLEIVKLLVENGADINSVAYFGKTPMANLVNTGKATTNLYPIYRYLAEKGGVNTIGGSRTRKQSRKRTNRYRHKKTRRRI